VALIVDLRTSHKYSFGTPVKLAFKLTLLPSSSGKAEGLHYILLMDTSGSMKGRKIELAREGARLLLRNIPEGNYVTLIAFGTRELVSVLASRALVDTERGRLLRLIDELEPHDGTPLYRALRDAYQIARASGLPGYIVLLSDGQPTDASSLERFRELEQPPGYRMVLVGIGLDYNHELFTLLADMSGGDFYHVSEAEAEKLPEMLGSFSVETIAARSVELVLESPAGGIKLLNYEEPVIKLPSIEKEPVTVLGEVEVPPLYEGIVLRARVRYQDPATGEVVEEVREAGISPVHSRDLFLRGIDREVLDEYNYFLYMARAREALLRGRLDEATQKLSEAARLAEQTRKISYIEATRRLLAAAEQTRRLGDRAAVEDATRRLLSEATRRLRRV